MRKAFVLIGLLTYSLHSQQPVPSIVDQGGGSYSMLHVAFGSDGKWLATSDPNGDVRIYDLNGGRLARTLPRAGSLIAVHPGRKALAASDARGAVAMYDVASGDVLWKVGSAVPCSALQFSPDGHRLYLGCAEVFAGRKHPKAWIKICDADTGREISTTSTPEESQGVYGFSSDGQWWYGDPQTASAAKQMFHSHSDPGYRIPIFETESGRKVGDVLGAGMVMGLSAKNHQAFLLGTEGLLLVDVGSGKQSVVTRGKWWAAYGLAAINRDGSLALLSDGASLALLDLATGEKRPVPATDLPLILGAAISPDNGHIALAQAGAVLLLSVSDPSDRRLIGSPERMMFSGASVHALISESQNTMSTSERRKLEEEYVKKMMKARGGWSLNNKEMQRLSEEYARRMNGDENQRREAQNAAEAEYAKIVTKFGSFSDVVPVSSFLESGRIMAVRAADAWWDAWDVTTGNRLPFRKPTGDVTKHKHPEALLDDDELQEIESALSGANQAAVSPASPAFSLTGEIGCKSKDELFGIEISRDADHLKSVRFRSADGRSVDLLATGIDASAWARRPAQSRHFYVCSLSSDGGRLIVEGINPGNKKNGRSSLAKVFAPKAEDFYGRNTADSLLLYDTQTGRKVCELENDAGAVSFDVLADELQFAPNGKFIVGGGASGSYGVAVKRRLRIWDASNCKSVAGANIEGEGVLRFSDDGRQLFTATAPPQTGMPGPSYGVRVWDVGSISASGMSPVKPLFELPEAIASERLLIASPNNAVLIGPDRDYALGFWDRRTGRRLGTLRALQEGEWLVTTPSGFFDGSPRGWSQIAWRESDSQLTTQPGEIFFNEFYRPGLLADLIEGHPPEAPRTIVEVDRRQPRVSLTAISTTSAERTTSIHVTVEEAPASPSNSRPSGARDLRLFRNGSLVKAWRGELSLIGGEAGFDAVVPLVAGENRFVAYAFNHDNVKSSDASLIVQCTAPRRRGTAYILAIGINRYANTEFNLNFAAPDARRLAEMLAQTQQQVGAYDKVIAVNLLDEQATRVNVLLALSRLGGRQTGALPAGAPQQLTALQQVQPEDAVVVFFAGHGTAFGDHFYLIPHDLGYAGPRDSLRNSFQRVLDSGISDQDLERAFEPVDAASIMLIIDACNAGKALDAEDERRGPLNSKGLAQLAYEKGMYVLTAAQAYQAALESSRLGHGYLTYALVEEGLTTPVADVKPADGQVTAIEWFEYATRRVPQLQLQALQEAAANQRVLRFEMADSAGGTTGRLQTPRVYYRRDYDASVPVVAKY